MDVFSGDLCPERPDPWRCPALSSLLSLLENVPALLWTTGAEPTFSALTGAGLLASGVASRDFIGKRIDELFSCAESPACALDAHRDALHGRVCSFSASAHGRDYDVHVQPLRSPGGSIVGVIGVALDDTERLIAQRALQLSEQNHRSLIEEAPYAICRVTQSGQLLQANRAMFEMLGYAPDMETDLLVRDLPLIFDSPDAFCSFRKELLNGNTVQGLDSAWICHNGRKIQVRVGGRAVRGVAGELLYLDVLAENVTDRKELEARLSQAEKMQAIGQLAGGVAHDFNNLLTVIGGQVEVLLDTIADSGQRTRLLDVQQAAARASALTRQLLAFSRRQLLRSQVLEVNQLIAGMSAMLVRLIRENISLTFMPGADAGYVRADPHQLEQVLMNLTVNAQDAMPHGGRVSIETSSSLNPAALEPGTYVCITVRDTGHGMDADTLSHIFEPFFTTKKTGEGTGLGLATVYGIVRQSGGQIQVDSQPGAGSVFTIYLPRVAAVERPPAEPVKTAPQPSPGGLETVLLAEDEDSVRGLLAKQLTALGYRVLAASNGEEALHLAQAHSGAIHLLLSDFVMPKMGGHQLALELRKTNPALRVILISGYAGHGPDAKELGLPDICFLGKPFSLRALAKTIREVLDRA